MEDGAEISSLRQQLEQLNKEDTSLKKRTEVDDLRRQVAEKKSVAALRESKMGKKFGNLGHLRGMIYQGISPFEQRAFAGAVSKGLPNLVKRFRTEVLFVVLPMAAVYAIYDWGEKKNHVLSRKNPADFINDE